MAETHSSFRRQGHAAHKAKMGRMGVHGDVAQDKRMIKSAVHQHENHEHGGKHTKLKLKTGGAAMEGEAATGRRHDRPGRAAGGPMPGKPKSGGKGGKGNHVNVIVAPGAGHQPMPPPAAAMPPRPPMPPPAPPPAMPPRPPMGGMPPGGPPVGAGVPGMGMRSSGGRTGRKDGGSVKMDAGAGGGLGRMEKIKDYGKGAKPREDVGDSAMLENKDEVEHTEPKKKGGAC